MFLLSFKKWNLFIRIKNFIKNDVINNFRNIKETYFLKKGKIINSSNISANCNE
jgi:hypothetical protein